MGNMEATFTQQQHLEAQQQRTGEDLEKWTKGMVETSAFKKVMEMLKKEPTWITIKGSPGEGKTTVAKMALRDLQKSGRQVFQVTSPEDFTKVTKACSQAVIMLDDILGDIEFDHTAWLKWKDVFHNILDVEIHSSHKQVTSSEKKKTTVLLIGRDYVLNAAADHMGELYDYIVKDSHVVDMSHSIKRGLDEKQQIWDAIVASGGINIPQRSVWKIFHLDGGHGFPHVCRLFVTLHRDMPNLSPEKFFQSPLAFLSKTIKIFLKSKNKLLLFKEMIKMQGKISEHDLEMLDTDAKQEALDLLGTYLRMEGGYFVFDHPSIYESVAFNMCKLHTSFVIDNGSLTFITKRLRLESPHDTECGLVNIESDLVVYISPPYAGNLAKRFAGEIMKRNIRQVLSHQACTQEMFIKQMMSQMSLPLTDAIRLTEVAEYYHDLTTSLYFEKSFSFLFLSSISRSPNLLKYIDSHIQLTQSDINTVLWGVCKFAASNILTYLKQTRPTLDINIKYEDKMETPLMKAAETGDSEFVSQIMSLDPNLSAYDSAGNTVLHYMCAYGIVSAVEKLIDRSIDIDTGIDVNKGWLLGVTKCSPLNMACRMKQDEVTRVLLDHGAKIDHDSLLIVCSTRSLDCLRNMLKLSQDRVSRDIRHFLSENYASYEVGEEPILMIDEDRIRCLVEAGSSVNRTDGKESLLHVACSGSQPQHVQCLVELSADLDTWDSSGYTPLHVAAQERFKEGTEVLLKAKAKVNACTENKEQSPLHMAVCYNGISMDDARESLPDISVCKTLITHGADVNQQDKEGNTPLHLLCRVERDTLIHFDNHTERSPDSEAAGLKPCTNDYYSDDEDEDEDDHYYDDEDDEDEDEDDHYSQWPPASDYQEWYRKLAKLLMDSGADAAILNNEGEPALRGWCKHLFETTGDVHIQN